ncbi:hypothetical protein N8517_00145 [Synechococcus sp. AH-601-L23]|nr:hypothetical protein [Synechococcus sp. AH-601-L23]
MTISNSPSSHWVDLASGAVPLRCCWLPVVLNMDDLDNIQCLLRVIIVPPEVFSLNGWVRSVAALGANGAWA